MLQIYGLYLMSHLLQSSSQLSCAETYAGPGPFSEPESQNIRDFVTSIQQNVVVRILTTFDDFFTPVNTMIIVPQSQKFQS